MTAKNHYAVLGAGSWGTALALVLARQGHAVTLWGKSPDAMRDMNEMRCNARYLPNIPLPRQLKITADLAKALKPANQILIVVPSHAFSEMLAQIKPYYKQQGIIWGTKGLAPTGGRFLHELVADAFGNDINMAILSGPSFAIEVANNQPSAVVIASQQKDFLWQVVNDFSHKTFRVYANKDIIGTQLGGVMKNILAIATGISDGLVMGANARSALVTRGLAEMLRLSTALGANQESLMGLSGIGDLILSCTDDQSRNRRFGLCLGAGYSQEEAKEKIGQVIEGCYHVDALLQMAKQHNIELPITQLVHQILQNKISPTEAIALLMNRELGYES